MVKQMAVWVKFEASGKLIALNFLVLCNRTPLKTLPDPKPLYVNSGKVLLTVRNQTFYSNKFKTPIYTYSIDKNAKVESLFLNLAQTLLVDPKMFTHSEGQPEGFNVFYWCDDGALKGTKMVKLEGNKTINDYGLDKNSVLYLKYRCR